MKAKVFISCGQCKGTDEVELAQEISDRLKRLGFETYVGVSEQSLLGLRENVFAQLESSEYFLFIDFRREKFLEGWATACRGSLFSHQELALASYLEMPVIALQEEGVKRDDGIIRFLQ